MTQVLINGNPIDATVTFSETSPASGIYELDPSITVKNGDTFTLTGFTLTGTLTTWMDFWIPRFQYGDMVRCHKFPNWGPMMIVGKSAIKNFDWSCYTFQSGEILGFMSDELEALP